MKQVQEQEINMKNNHRSTRAAAAEGIRTWMSQPSSTTPITRFHFSFFLPLFTNSCQWVPLYLIFNALLFYCPRLCWLSMEGGLMKFFGKGTTTRSPHPSLFVTSRSEIFYQTLSVGLLRIKRRRRRDWLRFSERILPTSKLELNQLSGLPV